MATIDAGNAVFETTEASPLLPKISDPTSSAPEADTTSTGLEPYRPRPPRNVTFNANPVTKTIEPSYAVDTTTRPSRVSAAPSQSPSAISVGGLGSGPMASLKTNLRRRNSQGPSGNTPTAAAGNGSSTASGLAGGVLAGTAAAVGASAAGPGAAAAAGPQPKIGPQRSTKKAQKLKLLPNPEFGEDGADEESGRDVYSQFTRIKDPTARRDAKRLGKADRERLPRVTAYCTANEYDMQGLLRFLKGRGRTSRGANPKLIDECIYTPYSYGTKQAELVTTEVRSAPERRHSTGDVSNVKDLLDLSEERPPMELGNGSLHDGGSDLLGSGMGDEGAIAEDVVEFDITVHTPEVFLFEYGVIVVWGMSAAHEQRFLKELAKFEKEKLAPDDVETENFNFYYTREYGARIYNDFITLRDKNNYMIKLSISHALAQSVKTSLFEELIASTIETCKDLPTQIALTGKIALSRSQINMQIGELFILRINIHLNGSVLDTPELFWVEPQLEPVYQAVRSYLEMDQRVGLLTERLDVIADLLAVLKDQLSHGHGEMLEWIVIILIAAEILVAAINIVVDLYAGVE